MKSLKTVLFYNIKYTLSRIVPTALKKAFAADKSIQKMAGRDFIMLNLLVGSLGEDVCVSVKTLSRAQVAACGE